MARDLRAGTLTASSVALLTAAVGDARSRALDSRDALQITVDRLTEALRAEHPCTIDGARVASVYPRRRRRRGTGRVVLVARRYCEVCGLDSDGPAIVDDEGRPFPLDEGRAGVGDVVLYAAAAVALVLAVSSVASLIGALGGW